MSNRHRLRASDWPRTSAKPVVLRESATVPVEGDAPAASATARQIVISEASTGGMTASGGRRYKARLIEGDRWGTSGYWPKKVVERDGPKVWPAGTQMFLNHPTETEEAERPERDVRDLAGTIVTTPTYEGDGLYATIEVFPHAQPLIESVGSAIGLSIRGGGTADTGTIAGRTGPVIESLTHGYSVDFVTRAGAGGKIMSLAEAARLNPHITEAAKRTLGAYIEAQLHLALTQMADDMYGHGQLSRPERLTLSSAIGDGLKAWTAKVEAEAPQLFERDIWDGPADDAASTDATTTEALRTDLAVATRLGMSLQRLREASSNDTQAALDTAIRTAYGDDGDVTQYLYVCDFDPDAHIVWYSVSDNQSRTTWQQTYELTTGDAATVATLGDGRTEVAARTEYVPVPSDADSSMSEADAQKPHGDVKYADPGYQDDKKARYPIDTKAHVKAALSYIGQSDNAGQYSADDLKKVKARIAAAAKEFGIEVAEAAPMPTPDVTDGAPPTAPTIPSMEETSVSGTQNTGPAPGAAGTADDTTAVSTAIAEAQQARSVAETALAESERRTAVAEARVARLDAIEAARPIITELLAESQVDTPTSRASVLSQAVAAVSLTEANVLDEAALRTATAAVITAKETELAEARQAAGAGTVTGLGGSSAPVTVDEAARQQARVDRFVSIGMSESAAKVAAKGGRI